MCEYTLEEVAAHCTRTSCWIVVHSKIYDVTDFLDEHPGGTEVLLEHAGTDATIAFEDFGHTQDARDLGEQYVIGSVVGQNDSTAECNDDQQKDPSSTGGYCVVS